MENKEEQVKAAIDSNNNEASVQPKVESTNEQSNSTEKKKELEPSIHPYFAEFIDVEENITNGKAIAEMETFTEREAAVNKNLEYLKDKVDPDFKNIVDNYYGKELVKEIKNFKGEVQAHEKAYIKNVFSNDIHVAKRSGLEEELINERIKANTRIYDYGVKTRYNADLIKNIEKNNLSLDQKLELLDVEISRAVYKEDTNTINILSAYTSNKGPKVQHAMTDEAFWLKKGADSSRIKKLENAFTHNAKTYAYLKRHIQSVKPKNAFTKENLDRIKISLDKNYKTLKSKKEKLKNSKAAKNATKFKQSVISLMGTPG